MKNRVSLSLLAIIVAALACFAFVSSKPITTTSEHGIKWLSFEEVAKLQKKTKKKIVMDVYTDWCGWCKRMDATTFSDPTVGEYVNKNYYALKLNAESKKLIKFNGKEMTEQELAARFGVTGYPTTVYLDESMELLSPVSGYLDVKQFTNVVKFYGENHYKSMNFEQFVQSAK